MRFVRILAWVAGGLVVLVILAGAALWFGGAPVAAWAIEHPVSVALGRQIRLGGPFTLHWGNPTRITADDVHVANASWGTAPDLFQARHLEIEIYLRSLVFAPIRIPSIELDGAKLLLETDAKGEGNWKFSTGTPKKRSEFPHLQHFAVTDGALTYRNGQTKAEADLGVTGLDLAAPDLAGPVKIVADGSLQKLPFHLDGSVGPIAQLRDSSKPYPIKFNGKLDHTDLAVDGTLQKPLDFDGIDLRLSMNGARLDTIASALGVPFPTLPDFRLTSELTGGNGSFAIKALTAKTGASDLEGGLAIDTNAAVPHIQANLTSKYMDLADFKGLYGGTPDKTSAPPKPAPQADADGRVLPDTRLEVHKLPGIDLDLSFDGAGIKSTGGLPFQRVSLGLQIQKGELTVKPLHFTVADGDVDFNLHYTPFTKDTPPRLQGGIDIRHLDLHKLAAGMPVPAFVKTTGGTMGGTIKIDTTGASVRDFLGRMNGDAAIFVENGQLSDLMQQLAPIDVLGALGVYVTGDKPIPVNCFVSRFDIKSGVATASTLLFDTPNTTIVGSGNVNFESETITLNLKPYNNNFTAISLRTPIDVGGTFEKPAYHLETGNLIARLGAAVGLGVLFPPAAILPLMDRGLGENNSCSVAYAAQRRPDAPAPNANTGSSQPARNPPK